MQSDRLEPIFPGRLSRSWHAVYDTLATLANAWVDDRCGRKAAALAYYTAFSMAPILVIVLAVASLVVDATQVSGALVAQASELFGPMGATLLDQLLVATRSTTERGWSAAIASVVFLVGATTAFAELKQSLDDMWHVDRTPVRGFLDLLHTRVISFGLVLVIALLLLVSLAMHAVLSVFSGLLTARLGDGAAWALRVGSEAVTLVVVALLFAAIYKLLPQVRLAWREVALGALVTTALFWLGKTLIGLYLGNSAPASAFGAAGSLAVILLWVYYSAGIFFLGAEVTRLFVRRNPRHDDGGSGSDGQSAPGASRAARGSISAG